MVKWIKWMVLQAINLGGSHKPSDRAQSGLDFGHLAAGKKVAERNQVVFFVAPTEQALMVPRSTEFATGIIADFIKIWVLQEYVK